MNWNAVRRTNRIRSQRKAKREAAERSRKARVEAAGGPITAAELRSAARRVEPGGSGNRMIDCHVWRFRGADWVLSYGDGETWQAFAPFVSWRMDGHQNEHVPMTPGAKKWLASLLASENEAAACDHKERDGVI